MSVFAGICVLVCVSWLHGDGVLAQETDSVTDYQMRFGRAIEDINVDEFNHLTGNGHVEAVAKQKASNMFKFMDVDGDEFVSAEEGDAFAIGLHGDSTADVQRHRKEFKQNDVDGDGKLTFEEMMKSHGVHHGDHDHVHLGRHPVEHNMYSHEEL